MKQGELFAQKVSDPLGEKILDDVMRDSARIDDIIEVHLEFLSDPKSADVVLKAIMARYKIYQAHKELDVGNELCSPAERDRAIGAILERARIRQTREVAGTEPANIQPKIEA
jgi:hypothetical protein